MAAQRADTGARTPDIPLQQQQVHQLLYVLGAVLVLGDPHAIADNGALGGRVGVRQLGQLGLTQAGDPFDILPAGVEHLAAQRGIAAGVLGDKGIVQQRRLSGGPRRLIAFDQQAHHPFQQRGIAADTHMIVGAGQRCLVIGQHLQRVLRRGKTLQPALL